MVIISGYFLYKTVCVYREIKYKDVIFICTHIIYIYIIYICITYSLFICMNNVLAMPLREIILPQLFFLQS